MRNSEPEYLRRIRKKIENQKRKTQGERDQTDERERIDRLVAAVGAIKEQYDRSEKERKADRKGDRLWERAGVVALAAAAVVGVVAIVVGSRDATDAINATTGVAAAARDQADVAKATTRPYIFIEFTGFNLQYLLSWDRGESKLRMPFHVKNYGTTPAIIEGVRCDEIHMTDIPSFNVINPLRGEPYYNPDSHQVIAASATSPDYRCSNPGVNGSFEQITSPIRDPSDVEKWVRQREIEIDRGELWFIAEARYMDVTNSHYYTTVCLQMVQTNRPPKEGGGVGCNERK